MVSVIVPMCDEEAYIRVCMDAIKLQDYPDGLLEILAVDGASNDQTVEIVRSWLPGARFPVRMLDNQGITTARGMNVGLRGQPVARSSSFWGAHSQPSRGIVSTSVESRFRTGGEAGFVDTVAFEAYRRDVFEWIGLFDEDLARNDDDEFNYRLGEAGGLIYFDPRILVRYFTRASSRAFFNQYHGYGEWTIAVARRHWKQVQP